VIYPPLLLAESTITHAEAARSPYLALVRDVLLGGFSPHTELIPVAPVELLQDPGLAERLAARGFIAAEPSREEPEWIDEGLLWPRHAMTMIGRRRLGNIEHCIQDVVAGGVPGDLIETGVWRGGGTIYMRAVLADLGERDRSVWVADSFAGLPPNDPGRYPPDGEVEPLHLHDELAVSLEEVRGNFARLGLLDERVVFLQGWFKDTLPTLADRSWAVIRLDGDLYESTIQALENLYPRLSPGGWLIVDDYGDIDACRQAVHDYRDAHGIAEPILEVDRSGVCWKRSP
jgi:O-methyltransferase